LHVLYLNVGESERPDATGYLYLSWAEKCLSEQIKAALQK
jgi:hypothetical protein